MAFINNNSKNIANILKQDVYDDSVGSGRLRLKKLDRSSVKQVGNPAIDAPIRPNSQEQPIISQKPTQLPAIDPIDQNPFSVARRRRDTPIELDESGKSVQLEQLTSSANNITLVVQSLEQQLYNEARRNRKNAQEIQFTRMKMQENTRLFQQRQAFLEAKFQAQFAEMQTQISRQKQGKMQVQQKVGNAELGQKQIVYMMKNIQDQYASQLLSIKSMVQDKRSDEQAALAKQKQKSTALFLQLVRQGDNLEKAKETLQSITNNFEGRVQFLQSKLTNNQKNLMTLAQRNSTGSDVMNEFGEKVLGRLHAVESNLLILGKDQLRNKEFIDKLDGTTNRVVQDLNNMLRTMQNDFQGRLENRVTEIVNRIVYEREERMKAQDEIKKNLDLRERLAAEKQLSEKDKLESRYQSMDAQIRAEFIRKDESLKGLQAVLQDQFRHFQKQIEKTEKTRETSESLIQQELKRVQQNFRKEYDIYKLHQTDLVQKITDMIKIEIGARLSSDVDLKNLTSAIATDLVTDLNSLKQAFSTSTKKMSGSIKEVKTESAERAAQLSHYVDEEVKKLAEVVTDKYNKMKNVFTKLSEHFRNHLISTESNRKNMDARLGSIQRDFEVLKNEVNSVIDDFHVELEDRMGNWQSNLQTLMFKKQNDTTVRLNKLEEYVNQHFDLIRQGIDGNKQLLNNRLSNFSNEKGQATEVTNEQFKELVQLVHRIKQINENVKLQNQTQIKQLKTNLHDNQQKNQDDVMKLKTELTQRQNDQQTKIAQLQAVSNKDVSRLVSELEELKKVMDADRNSTNQNFQNFQKDVERSQQNLKNLESALKVAQEHSDAELAALRSQLTILQSQVKTSDKTIHEDINRLIQITDMLKSQQK